MESDIDRSLEPLHLRQNLDDLQSGALRILTLLAGVIGYVWLMSIMSPHTGKPATLADWAGSSLLLLAAIIAYTWMRRMLRGASVLLVAGTLVSVSFAILAFGVLELTYLFALPIIFASVLLDEGSTFVVFAFACLLIVLGARFHFALHLSASAMVLPIVVIGMITVASWLSARNLYVALDWVWTGYETAHRNERMAREGQAELRQTLKALDEATYRLERANYMLAIARDQADDARRLKQQFAQTISHELRTPLNLIVGFTELMIQTPEYYGGALSAKHARDLGIVYRNACHLQSLVNDVLDLARIETAQIAFLPEETDLVSLTREAVKAIRSLVETRGLMLYTEISPDLPTLRVDPGRIRQVLFNLLTNAARFTEQGSVTVKVTRNRDEVLFAIHDTGMGIADRDKARIFEEFQQADGGTSRQHEGAGLGLSISKRFVELHGGRIWVESQVGQGSTFYFTLPSVEDDLTGDQYIPVIAARAISGDRSEEPILLAVTQSTAAATLLSHYVHGCRTVAVKDLKRARQASQQLLPQAVVIDSASEEMDVAALRTLAQEWDLPHTPFLAVPLPGGEVSRRRTAADGYLVKPVSRKGLWDILRQFGSRVDKILIIDDDRDFVRLMGRLLDSPVRRYQIYSAYNGSEGLEMIRRHQPDLVLLDVMLPDINGAQVIARVRTDPAYADLPIVFVSAQDEIPFVETLPGVMIATKATGLLPGEIVQWIQQMLHEAPSSDQLPEALSAVSSQ